MPPRVVTLTNDVESDLLVEDVIEEPLRRRPVSAAIDMDDDFRGIGSCGILDSIDCCLHELAEIGPGGIRAAADLPIGPQQPGSDLIPDLDVIGQSTGSFQ